MLAVILGVGAGPEDRLGLGDLAGDAVLGVLLRALLPLALGSTGAGLATTLLGLLAAAALGLPLCPGLRHRRQRVSLCGVWRPHQRQNLRISIRSGVFRRDLFVS